MLDSETKKRMWHDLHRDARQALVSHDKAYARRLQIVILDTLAKLDASEPLPAAIKLAYEEHRESAKQVATSIDVSSPEDAAYLQLRNQRAEGALDRILNLCGTAIGDKDAEEAPYEAKAWLDGQ